MANESQPELAELLTLQRQTLTKLNSLVDTIAAPRRVEIERDDKGAITGARVVTSDEDQS